MESGQTIIFLSYYSVDVMLDTLLEWEANMGNYTIFITSN